MSYVQVLKLRIIHRLVFAILSFRTVGFAYLQHSVDFMVVHYYVLFTREENLLTVNMAFIVTILVVSDFCGPATIAFYSLAVVPYNVQHVFVDVKFERFGLNVDYGFSVSYFHNPEFFG